MAAGGRMTIFVAIVGLGLLDFRPRARALRGVAGAADATAAFLHRLPAGDLEDERNGIEYGVGAIPLGGFVKIPGMHRPAPSDVDAGLRPGARSAPRSRARPIGCAQALGSRRWRTRGLGARLRERGAGGADSRARCPRRRPERGRPRTTRSGRTPTGARRRGSGSPRSPGPARTSLLAIVLFTGLFMTSGEATTTASRAVADAPATRCGAPAGDPIVSIDGRRAAEDISRVIASAAGR